MRDARTVVITGARGRLGKVMSRQFEAQGDRVIAIDRDGSGKYVADLVDESSVVSVFESVIREEGGVDVLVHSVGTWAQWSLLDTRLEDWERMMRINLSSSFLCFREAVRHMQNRGGTIIGIGAMPGVEGASAMGGAYAASKAGLMRLIEATAAEFPTVRCFGIAPSLIKYGGEAAGTRGVAAGTLAELAADLATTGTVVSGTTIEAYGSLA